MKGSMKRKSTSQGLSDDAGVGFDNSKPREERDYKEFYPDMEDDTRLKVFIQDTCLSRDRENEPDEGNKKKGIYGWQTELKKPIFREVKDGENPSNVRFPKSITQFGFQEPNRSGKKVPASSYFRTFSLGNNELIESMIKRKRSQVEYDMDEQDMLYLKHRNEAQESTLQVSPEVFEILMTILENEWEGLELKLAGIPSSEEDLDQKNTMKFEGLDDDKYGNDDGVVLGSEVEQKCAVCNDSECDNSNAIVFCDGCNIAVHQECYGIAFIPEGQWLCRKCMINKNREIGCVFCPSKTGAFKQLDNSLWSHVICALWINELYFANPIYMEPIEGLDLIPKSRWKLTCYICKQKVGACIQCSNRSCFLAYHVTCAKRAGLYMTFTKGLQGALADKTTLESCCHKHCPLGLDEDECIQGINKTRLYFRDLKILSNQNAQLSRNQKTANKLNIFKWKTESNTPIAPKAFSDKLFETLMHLNIEDQHNINLTNSLSILRDLIYLPNKSRELLMQEVRDISNEICRYWCLKRESKKGAPLIRKNNNMISASSIVYGDNNAQNISKKLDVANVLLKDLERLTGLAADTSLRQETCQSLLHLDLDTIEIVYFPLKKVLENVVDDLIKLDPSKLLTRYESRGNTYRSWSLIRQKVSNYEYLSVETFGFDVLSLCSKITSENKPSSSIYKVANRITFRLRKLQPSLIDMEEKLKSHLNNGHVAFPFVDTKGSSIKFKYYDPKCILEECDLSEVGEEIPEEVSFVQNLVEA